MAGVLNIELFHRAIHRNCGMWMSDSLTVWHQVTGNLYACAGIQGYEGDDCNCKGGCYEHHESMDADRVCPHSFSWGGVM